MSQRGKLFAFEGLDCSFKETNSKAYLEYLRSLGRTAELFSFPRYDLEPSYFVKEYLAGKYGKQESLNESVISLFYMMDMFDCVRKHINPLLEQGVDVILDRYWYSNIYYRLGLLRKTNKIKFNNSEQLPDYYPYIEEDIADNIIHLSITLKLPIADYIIKLQSDPSVMLNFVKQKNLANDQHESDTEFLLAVSSVFNDFRFKELSTNPAITIMTTTDKEIRPREDILNDIIRGIGIC